MKIRYRLIKKTVNNLFIDLKINRYPIEIIAIYKSFKNCRVVPYSKHMKKFSLSTNEVIEHFGSDEGCTIYNTKKHRYLVFYNDLNVCYKIPERRRWTLAHELGHILLNHHVISNKTKIFRNNLTDNEYKWMEAEANWQVSVRTIENWRFEHKKIPRHQPGVSLLLLLPYRII